MEVKTLLPDIDKLKTSMEIRETKDKDGVVVDRQFVTKVSFEVEVPPGALSEVHKLQILGHPISVCIGSTQAVMELSQQEGAVASR